MEQALPRIRPVLAADDPQPGFADLVALYAADIRRVLAALIDDPMRVDDLVQETFIRAHAALERTRPDNPGAWLRRIAVHAARDHHRSAWQRKVELVGTDHELREPDTTEAVWLASEQARRVRAAVSQLPDDWGEAVRLHFLLGMTYAAAAELLGLPESTLRSRVKAALPRLRTTLADWFEE